MTNPSDLRHLEYEPDIPPARPGFPHPYGYYPYRLFVCAGCGDKAMALVTDFGGVAHLACRPCPSCKALNAPWPRHRIEIADEAAMLPFAWPPYLGGEASLPHPATQGAGAWVFRRYKRFLIEQREGRPTPRPSPSTPSESSRRYKDVLARRKRWNALQNAVKASEKDAGRVEGEAEDSVKREWERLCIDAALDNGITNLVLPDWYRPERVEQGEADKTTEHTSRAEATATQ